MHTYTGQVPNGSGPGACFVKDPITYRARKPISNDLYLKKKAVNRH